MSAWYYYRGKLEPVLGEHPGVIGAVYRGKARVRYHEDLDTLAVQARSRLIVSKAIEAYLAQCDRTPERVTAEWPGTFIDCYLEEWRRAASRQSIRR